jgi:hypothetical protein
VEGELKYPIKNEEVMLSSLFVFFTLEIIINILKIKNENKIHIDIKNIFSNTSLIIGHFILFPLR